MLFPTTVTSKGQIFLPKSVRDETGILSGKRAFVSVLNGKVVVESALTIDDIYGSVKSRKVLTKKEMKRIVRDAVVAKFDAKNRKWNRK